METFDHTPVLLSEVLELLYPEPGARILDCTVGLGGHSKALLECNSDSTLVALDADQQNLNRAKNHLEPFGDRVDFFHKNFIDVTEQQLGTFDIIFADLGISSVHLDDPQKGFSFRNDGPLDMRLDQSSGITAAEHISQSSEEDLANTFYHFGEIRQSRKLATAVKQALPKTTLELSTLCEDLFGFRAKNILPQVFQALRIAVNAELDALQVLLQIGPTMLNTGGKLGIISFHSLEDRMVKQTFRSLSTPEIDDTTGQVSKEAPFTLVTKKAVKPTEEEVEVNPRSRSARLRVLQRI